MQLVKFARNLGVIVAYDLSLDSFYINNMRHSAPYALYKIGRIRIFFDEKILKFLLL